MTRGTVVQPEAEADLVEAFRWYEARKSGLGQNLLTEVEIVFRRIVEAPKLAPVVHREVRRARVRRFPYLVYYVAGDEKVVVLAVLHERRHPKVFKSRASESE